MTHYLLWDIDGTLLTTERAGIFALEQAAREVLDVEVDLQRMPTAGLTDAEIARRILTEHGGAAHDNGLRAFLRAYERALPDRLPLRRGRVMAGVQEILEDLATRDDVVSLLLTGNVEQGARAKLAHYGLGRFFDGGAFCIDDTDRHVIARRALDLAREHAGGVIPPREQATVIGDTPQDVASGKAIGVRTLAVATGAYSLAELAACDPWLAIDRLPEPRAFAVLLGLERPAR